MHKLPDYRPQGGEQSLPAPEHLTGTRLWLLLLKCRRGALQTLCDRYLNLDPTGETHYSPLSDYVLVSCADVARLDSSDPTLAGADYREMAVFIPVLSGPERSPRWQRKLRLFAPYMVTDDITVMVTGREVFGLARQHGFLSIDKALLESPDAPWPESSPAFSLTVTGHTRDGEINALRPLLDVFMRRALVAPREGASSFERSLSALDVLETYLPSWVDPISLLADTRLVGLKQFRDAGDNPRACFQSLVETPVRMQKLKLFTRVDVKADVVIRALKSHPLADDMGLSPTTAVTAAFYLHGELQMDPGIEVWRAPPPSPPTTTAYVPRRRIAVLGGGMASLSALLAITEDPDWQERYELTVYQMGWRLGGKAASGRSTDPALASRIEEHGLHVWFSFYENAFRTIRKVYRDLNRPHSVSVRDWDDAFKPQDVITVNELVPEDDRWDMWSLEIPRADGTPGDGSHMRIFLAGMKFILGAIAKNLDEVVAELGAEVFGVEKITLTLPGWQQVLRGSVFESTSDDEDVTSVNALRLLLQMPTGIAESAFGGVPLDITLRVFSTLLRASRDRAWALFSHHLDHRALRKIAFSLDTLSAIATGIVDDALYKAPRDLSHIDGEDFRAWLGRHGCDARTLRSSPTIRFIYNAAFAFEDGVADNPRFAAGAALRGVLRLLCTYKGAIAYRMTAGMGDVVIAPIYELLRKRRVTFKFFHRVEKLTVAEDRKTISAIRIQPQCKLAARSYEPLIDVRTLPCWPSEPDYEQLENGAAIRATLAAAQSDFEDPTGPVFGGESVELVAGKDFDTVLLGIPVAALKTVCADLVATDPAWESMVANVKTVATQAFQVWSNSTLEQMGWSLPLTATTRPMMGTYVQPIDTYCDMTHLLPMESWPFGAVRSVAYFCGVVDEPERETHAEAMARAKANAIQYLTRDGWYLWSQFATKGVVTVKWDLLHDPSDGTGEARFDRQYWRANVRPSERYTLSLPGTIRHRMKAYGSGYANLFLCGDWIDNGFNSGCIEATVMSGIQAARAITGVQHKVVGETDEWLWGR